MDNNGTDNGHVRFTGNLLRTHGHGTRCRRESRADVQETEGEQG